MCFLFLVFLHWTADARQLEARGRRPSFTVELSWRLEYSRLQQSVNQSFHSLARSNRIYKICQALSRRWEGSPASAWCARGQLPKLGCAPFVFSVSTMVVASRSSISFQKFKVLWRRLMLRSMCQLLRGSHHGSGILCWLGRIQILSMNQWLQWLQLQPQLHPHPLQGHAWREHGVKVRD